ncbi:type II CAAX prenyl endopeptidase Rce1 family protein [uncultured Methanobrevibacter sp.]|uniref:CPBP family glutamic-type intramembrane protease n=1 Tax=uncultured Methanobrevibacter sp. TaxID=253161 RepID=UPI002609BAE9|nr:hypothetical protein [uncultured Methanobrevibacter sp.]
MSNIDWFKFENKDLDFPIYKKNPRISKIGWIVLFLALVIGYVFVQGSQFWHGIIACIVLIVPVLYFLKWDYKAIFQKPALKDVALAIGLFIAYILYAYVMTIVLSNFGIVGSSDGGSTITFMDIPPLIFSLMGEEFIKFIPFIFFLRIFFKYTDNRKLSVIVSVLVVMVLFACIHAYDFKMLLFALFIQGLGSVFEFIGYIKTKNVLISYITHLCTDVFIYMIIIMGIG